MQQRYEVYDPIASGTYGTIHQCAITSNYAHILQESGADDVALRQYYAVKIQRHDPYFWDNFSFLREIDALMRTRRFPGTVDVLDCVLDTERECAFIVMDHYDGTLLHYINQVPFEERVRHMPFICAQLLVTMAYLDRQGIAHRDIKPSNLLVQRAPVHGHQLSECALFADCEYDMFYDDDDDEDAEDEELQRFRDCMRLFTPLISPKSPVQRRSTTAPPPPPCAPFSSSSFVRSSSNTNTTATTTTTTGGGDDGRLTPQIVLCDESGTPTPLFAMDTDEGGGGGNDDDAVIVMDAQDGYASEISNDATPSPEWLGAQPQHCTGHRSRQHHTEQAADDLGSILHTNDGRPRSFPGPPSRMASAGRASVRSPAGARTTTTDGESNTLSAGDLASLHRTPLVVVCDFGLAKQLGPSRDTPCLVTLNFRPPEMFVDMGATDNGSSGSSTSSKRRVRCAPRYRTNVDVWSLACVLMQYVTGTLLFQGTNEYYVMRAVADFIDCVPKAWERIGWKSSGAQSTHEKRVRNIQCHLGSNVRFADYDAFCDLLAHMFDPSSESRPSATELLTHPYVAPYVQRTMRFMCGVTQQRRTYGEMNGAVGPGRVLNGHCRGTARWAFQTGVDVSTERLDVSLGLPLTQTLTAQHRELMCDWLWEQNRTLRYDPGTALAAIHNFDRFMSNASTGTASTLTQSTYVLVCIICFYLTIHYYERYVADLPTLIGACGFSYDARHVKRMIRTVLVALHFQVSTPSHWTLYCRYRGTMHMPRAMDGRVAMLLYLLLRRIYFAAAIPKAVLLTQTVERVRFNRHYEQFFSSIRLRPISKRGSSSNTSTTSTRWIAVPRRQHSMLTRSQAQDGRYRPYQQ